MTHIPAVLGASSPLTKIVPGLMIWTLVFFAITFYVLKRFAFGPIQKIIDERQEHIRRSFEDAEAAREQSRELLEEQRVLLGEARGQAEQIIAEARHTRDALDLRMREETEAERQRRLEETRREIAAETARALQQIRAEVAELTVEAASRVVGRALDSDRDRELIAEAIGSLDFSQLEESA
jgi:F-type H+-transporting ATPase subunit b